MTNPKPPIDEIETGKPVCCPKCGSTGYWIAPEPSTVGRWHCEACKHWWGKASDEDLLSAAPLAELQAQFAQLQEVSKEKDRVDEHQKKQVASLQSQVDQLKMERDELRTICERAEAELKAEKKAVHELVNQEWGPCDKLRAELVKAQEKDARLSKYCDELSAQVGQIDDDAMELIAKCKAERDAALLECEKLQSQVEQLTEVLKREALRYNSLEVERDQARRDAEEANKRADYIWSHTCVHHTDAERLEASQKCPVCLLAENGKAIDFCIGLTSRTPDEILEYWKKVKALEARIEKIRKEADGAEWVCPKEIVRLCDAK